MNFAPWGGVCFRLHTQISPKTLNPSCGVPHRLWLPESKQDTAPWHFAGLGLGPSADLQPGQGFEGLGSLGRVERLEFIEFRV